MSGYCTMLISSCFVGLVLSSYITMTDARRLNATYDPMKGTFMDSFQDPSGKFNCSVYFVYRTMFLIDGCDASGTFIRGLKFTFSNVTVPRVISTPYGLLLEVARVNWDDYDDRLILNITSRYDPRFFKTIAITEINYEYKYFDIPTLRGLSGFYGRYVESTSNNMVMNTKMIMIFYLEFGNYYGCDAYFWVGRGDEPDSYGMKIPDEYGSLEPLKNYYQKTITLKLPRMDAYDRYSKEMTIYDIDYIGIYCPRDDMIYGSISTREISQDKIYPIRIHPPFIFDRFFLGEDIILCLPNGTYSRELNLDDSKTDLPCLGGSVNLAKNGLQKLLLTIPAAILLLQYKAFTFRKVW